MPDPRRIIIDTDPGQDDAVAILLAFASPELDVAGITCVAGNVPLALTARNARVICELAGRSRTPVFAGCDRPMRRPLVTAEHVHGKTGLDGIALPDPAMPLEPRHAVDFLIDTLRAEPPGTLTLCPLGPLTNIATAFERAPDIVPRVAEIVLMGGGYFEGGNITPAAEFNIYVDPEAADIVFRSGAPLVVMPLDVTHKALTSRAWPTSAPARSPTISGATRHATAPSRKPRTSSRRCFPSSALRAIATTSRQTLRRSFPASPDGRWRRSPGRCRPTAFAGFWTRARRGALRRGCAIGPSCCCWRGWGCAHGRSSGSNWTTSTGRRAG